MKAIKEHEKLQLQVVATASALLDRYGSVVELIENDGFGVDAKIFSLIEGETLQTMAKSTGIGLIELPTVFEKLKPDIVVTVGDRFETMATTLAAAYMNIPLAHTMGGEVTGTIDESIRHAITKFAHIHFPASEDAAKRIVKLGERSQDVYLVGCPRIDLVAQVLKENEDNTDIFLEGVGSKFDLRSPFILVSQHPVTTEYGEGENQIQETLLAVKKVGLPAIVLWPNSDAGAEDIARGIRKWRERGLDENMHFFKNLPTETYIRLMKTTACLVGNSSSGIREGAYIGTPVVNIGSRQDSRARASNVIDIAEIKNELIEKAIQKQILHGCYQSEHLYGDGSSGQKIADILSKCSWQIQKRISY